ncbi:MAG: hypothetical protein IPK58_08465 [Acidobacteria bacterium]|nr:hypothetical protein [Acidobacteriota bacterium]
MQTNKAARDRDDRSYQYYQDGTLKFMEDRLSAQGHRLFRYDNLSRVVETRTGIEAKGQAPADPPPSGLLYRQDYTFNEFGNLTARSGIWKPGSNCGHDGDFPFSHIYQNNRTVGDYYDADGRPTNKDGFSEVYESAGRNVRHLPNDGEYELDRVYDGDGLEVKKIEKVWDFENNQWKEPTRKYYIRSTVNSGEIITEVAGDGKKSQTLVYAGADLLARQR